MYNNYRYSGERKSSVVAVVLYFIAIAALVVFDQLTKYWAVSRLSAAGSMPVIGDYVRFTYAENKGAAFSILQNKRVFLIAVPAVLSVACLVAIFSRRIRSILGNISLTLIAAGGIGNLIDRCVRGYVVDFIDFNVIHFAIFNVADSCVTIGVVLFVVFAFVGESNHKRRPKSDLFAGRF